ncbi:MAG: sigma-70 family RNA polymerase sigma factor [Oscillospiraceae bacterium]|nr:sigma-70 family RNA polymerase sigma factor [Oscillospiraceae bacterium]
MARKSPWKPLQTSITTILRRRTTAWEKLNPSTVVKRVGGRIANEILMHFRAQRKSAQDVSLSDYIETGADGAPLALMDVVAEDCDLLEQVSTREQVAQLRRVIDACLSEQERQVILLRYGLNGQSPKRQREVADITGISRSYVSRIEKRALEKLRAELEK